MAEEKTFPHPVVQVKEDGYVIIKKQLAGNAYSTSDSFNFKVTVDSTSLTNVKATAATAIPKDGNITYTDEQFTQSLTGTPNNGATSYTVEMTGNQYVVIKLPEAEGCTVSVSEVKADGTVLAKNDTADKGYKLTEIDAPTNQKLEENNLTLTYFFTNTKDMPTPTGVDRDILPYVITMAIALAGAAMLLLENERRKRLGR